MADIEVPAADAAAGTTMPMFPPTASSGSASAPPQSRTVAWEGRRSAPVTMEATIPVAKPRPAVPSAPTTSLLTLTALRAITARGKVMPRMNADGASMSLDATVHAEGLGGWSLPPPWSMQCQPEPGASSPSPA